MIGMESVVRDLAKLTEQELRYISDLITEAEEREVQRLQNGRRQEEKTC